MNVPVSVLLYAQCPTGEHVGSVVGTLYDTGRKVIEYPLRYECGCEDPR